MVSEAEILPDHYGTLNISITSTLAEIKKAYHKIAREHHPDRNPDGDIELFKKATIAYELLREPNERQNYDLKLQMSRSYSPRGSATHRSTFATSSRSTFREPFSNSASFSGDYFAKDSHAAASAASAASAAFKTSRSEPSEDQKEYLRRPRQTKFSKRESPLKEKPTKNSVFEDSPPSPKLSSSDFEDAVSAPETQPDANPQTEANAASETKADIPPPSYSTVDPPSGDGSTKRKVNPSNASPKRRRVYEMDELKSVSPLSEEYQSPFHFSTLSGALPRVTTKPRPRTFRRSPPTTTHTGNYSTTFFPPPPANHTIVQNMVSEYADVSTPILSALMGLHNERFAQDASQIQSVYESFVKTKALLEDLLVGTNNALHILESV